MIPGKSWAFSRRTCSSTSASCARARSLSIAVTMTHASRVRLWLLIEPEDVPRRIREGGERVAGGAQRGPGCRHLPSGSHDAPQSGIDVVDHHIGQEAGFLARFSPAHPGAAHRAGGVVERAGAVTARSRLPAKHLRVEGCRHVDVAGGNLEVADLAMGHGAIL